MNIHNVLGASTSCHCTGCVIDPDACSACSRVSPTTGSVGLLEKRLLLRQLKWDQYYHKQWRQSTHIHFSSIYIRTNYGKFYEALWVPRRQFENGLCNRLHLIAPCCERYRLWCALVCSQRLQRQSVTYGETVDVLSSSLVQCCVVVDTAIIYSHSPSLLSLSTWCSSEYIGASEPWCLLCESRMVKHRPDVSQHI